MGRSARDLTVLFLIGACLTIIVPSPVAALVNLQAASPARLLVPPVSWRPGIRTAHFCSHQLGEHEEPSDIESERVALDRRQFLLGSAATVISLSFSPPNTQARGLVKFPVDDPRQLLNTYHFLRVGDTLLEDEDIWSTNPLFLTNREAALSPKGAEQIQAACALMEKAQRTPTVVKYSLAASCIDTANIVGDTLDLGRDRIVPEFTFLDPRGIGKWEMLSYSQTKPAVWALDALEAGPNGTGGRPPANQDGTPNDTLADQAVRLRQLMSVLETLYSGETVLVVFPDGTGPALLSAMIAGIPLNRVHELDYEPGELRLDVTKASILEALKDRDANQRKEYDEAIAVGRNELEKLRSTIDIVSLKDQKIEAERIAIDEVYNERETQRLKMEGEARESRLERRRSSNGDGSAGIPLSAVGAASLVGTAGIFAVSGVGEKATTTTTPEVDPAVKQKKDASLDDGASNDAMDASLLADESSRQDDTQLLQPTLLRPPKPADPYEAAEKAMEEYLSRDDGANDWLSVMSQIIEEDEEADESSNECGTKSFE